MTHFDFRHGQKWRILTFSIKAKIFVYYKQMIIVLWKESKFFIFDHVKIGHILPKQENAPPIFLYVAQYMANYQKINRKLKKYWGKINSLLPWTQILKWALRPLFCIQVKSSCVLSYIFIRSFDFGTKQELCMKKFMPRFGQGRRQHGCSGCICTRQFPATGALHPSWRRIAP